MTERNTAETGAEIINSGCSHDCGGRCVLRVHVKDGRIVRIEGDTGDEKQFRACLRGRSYRQRLYHEDRLLYPLRRVGERGEGKFERISWDEALAAVAKELNRVKETYGNEALFYIGYSGGHGQLHGMRAVFRLLNKFGGCSKTWGGASHEGGIFASMATYGTLSTGNTRDDLASSKLIIMWGWNPGGNDLGYQHVAAPDGSERGGHADRVRRSPADFLHRHLCPRMASHQAVHGHRGPDRDGLRDRR